MAENSDDDNSDDDNDDDDDKECSDSEGRTEGADAGVTDPPPASIAVEQEAKETGVETLPVHFHPGCGRDEWVSISVAMGMSSVSQFGLAVRHWAGRQKDLGSIPLQLSFSEGLWFVDTTL